MAATYAGILDGRHLWLCLPPDDDTGDGEGGGGELRGPGEPIALTGETTDLLAALPPGEASYAVHSRGRPVTVAPFADDSPTRVPVAPDGITRFDLHRDDDGHLHVRRHVVEPTAVLESIGMRGAEVHLSIRPPAAVRTPEHGPHLVLLDAEDRVLDQLPATAHDDRVEALLGAGDLPGGYYGILRLAVGDEHKWVRVRRRADDLVDAHRAVLLPELHADAAGGADEDDPVARFRWNPDGFLVVRVLEPGHGPVVPEATVTSLSGRGRREAG